MSEVLRGRELLQGVQVERCPRARLHWEERGESLHHRSPLETVEARRSVKKTSSTLNQGCFVRFFLRFYFLNR